MKFPNLSHILIIVFLLFSCSKDKDEEIYKNTEVSVLSHSSNHTPEEHSGSTTEEIASNTYATENIIILVIDGPRFSETWGDPNHENIPVLSTTLSKKGVINTQFFNLGITYTSPGHTAITTGNYQEISNDGSEHPKFPSIFQHWKKKNISETKKAYIIASKDKIEVLSDTNHSEWKDNFKPLTNCGNNGLFSGYRSDEITYKKTFEVLSEEKPQLVLINLKDPDFYAHQNRWADYLEGIRKSDEFMGTLWSFLQKNPHYSNKTTLFMTNDHGRHLDGIKNGYVQHGDDCMGCRHINFFAAGPDFKQNFIIKKTRSQVDITATVAELLDFKMPYGQGSIMWELFQ